MNFFKKRSTAWCIFVIAVVCSFFTGERRRQVTHIETLPSGVYVQDRANLLSEETEKHITEVNNGLVSAFGGEIQVAVIDSTGGEDIFDMAYELADDTNLSGKCCVFLVAVDDVRAVIVQGQDVAGGITNNFLDEIINNNFTVSDFENRDVDFAVRSTFDRLVERYEDYYGITVKASNTIQRRSEGVDSYTYLIIGVLVFMLMVILVVYIVTRPGRRRTVIPTAGTTTRRYPSRGSYRTPPPYSGGSSRSGGFGSSSSRGGSFSSSSSSSRSSRSGGFGSSSSRGGSFSSSRSFSSRGGGFSSGGSRGGSFRGGGSRGGGFRK